VQGQRGVFATGKRFVKIGRALPDFCRPEIFTGNTL
jgi:hypothetical protein